MEDKIAIHCKTEAEWNKTRAKLGKSACTLTFDQALRNEADQSGEICLSDRGGWSSKGYYARKGYTIITAQEYLNEGGKDVSEFEGWSIPPNVSCEDAYQYIDQRSYPCESTEGWNFNKQCVSGACDTCIMHMDAKESFRKYMQTKGKHIPLSKHFKTTKENNMSININSTVAKVFKDVDEAALVTKWVGSEYEEDNHRAFMYLKGQKKTVLEYVTGLEEEAKKDK